MDEYRREAIVSLGSVLGLGYFSNSDDSAAGPIIVDGDATGPSLDIQDVYLLDETGAPVDAADVFANEAYEVEAVVKNTGADTGTRELVLVRGETTVDERMLELDPAESQTLFFSPTAPSVSDGPETYAIGLADADAGDLSVLPRVRISVVDAALLDGSGNRVDARTLTEGEILEAVAELENSGIDSGEISLALELAGSQLDSATTTVGPDAGVVEQQLSGEVPSVDERTEYAAQIADQSAGTVTVEPAPAISEADQKLIHRWYLSEDSAPFIDQIGTAESTSVTGTTQVTGDWTDNAARDGDGTDDVIQTTSWGSFGSSMDTDFAVAFSVANVDTTGYILGGIDSTGNQNLTFIVALNDSFDGADGPVTFVLRGDGSGPDYGSNYLCIDGSTDLSSGGPYRVVINKTGNTASDIGVYTNQTSESATTLSDDFVASDVRDFSDNIPFFARNLRGSFDTHLNGTLDDICVFGDSLTESEIQSYQNPWS